MESDNPGSGSVAIQVANFGSFAGSSLGLGPHLDSRLHTKFVTASTFDYRNCSTYSVAMHVEVIMTAPIT